MPAPPRIETDRLVMRGWRDEDLDPWTRMSADPEVMAHFPSVLDPGAAAEFVDRVAHAWATSPTGLWAVELRHTAPSGPAPFVGFVGLLPADWLAPGAVEVGWRLDRPHWGHGYAPEAATHALAHAFLTVGLDEVVAFTVAANHASRRVMEKVGMVRAPSRDFDHPRVDPATHPHLVRHEVWAVTASDWRALHAGHP